jgi:uncharacterized protein
LAVCLSSAFFVNIQEAGLTFAIWGPFRRSSDARRRRIAVAEPPAHLAPRISGELAEAAERYDMSRLEAAAFASLGAPLV